MLPGANSVRDGASSGSSQRNGRHALGWLEGDGWVPALNPPHPSNWVPAYGSIHTLPFWSSTLHKI